MITIYSIVIFSILFILVTTIFGEFINIAFSTFILREVKDAESNFDIIDKIIIRIALGVLLIPVIVLAFTIFGNILLMQNIVIVVIVTFFIIILYNKDKFIDFHQKTKNKSTFLFSFFTRKYSAIYIKILIFILIFIFFLQPTLGLYVYPGGDARAYAFLTLRIIEEGGITFSFGKYPYFVPGFHSYMFGFPALNAFFSLISFTSIGEMQLFLIQFSQALVSIAIYLFVKFKTEKSDVALCASVLSAFIAKAHVDYFSWGGVSESMAIFLGIIVLIYMEILLNKKLFIAKVYILALSALMVGIFHFYATILIITYLLSILVYNIIVDCKNLRKKIIIKNILIVLIMIIFFTPVTYIVYKELARISSYLAYYEAQKKFLVPLITYKNLTLDGIYDAIIFFGNRYQSLILLQLSFFGIFAIYFRRYRELLMKAIIWLIIIFIITENSPYGLFFIVYPGSYQIYPSRLYLESYIIFSIIGSFGIYILFKGISHLLYIINSILTCYFKNNRITYLIDRYKTKITVLILIIIIAPMIYTTAYNNYFQLVKARKEAIVTEYDLKAYEWIKKNTPEDAIFFTSGYDGGAWIPMYTHRIILPPHTLRNPTVMSEFEKYAFSLMKGDIVYNKKMSLDTLYFFNYFSINYIYIGAKTQYGLPKIDPNIFMGFPGFNLIFNNTNVFIFRINETVIKRIINVLNKVSNNVTVTILNPSEGPFYIHDMNNYSIYSSFLEYNNKTIQWKLRGDTIAYNISLTLDNDKQKNFRIIFDGSNITGWYADENSWLSIDEIKHFVGNMSLNWTFNTAVDISCISFRSPNPIKLDDFLVFDLIGNFSYDRLDLTLYDSLNNYREYRITLNGTNWQRKVIPINNYYTEFGAFNRSKIKKFKFQLDLKSMKTRFGNNFSTIFIGNIQTTDGQWCDIAISLPDIELIDINNNSIPEIYLMQSGKIFAYWDYNDLNTSLIETYNMFFMSGIGLDEIVGANWKYGVALYPIGSNNESVINMPNTYGIGTRKIQYPTKHTRYLGFSIYMPPDDFSDNADYGISQTRITIYIVLEKSDIIRLVNEK